MNEVKELKTSILVANTGHNQEVVNSINTLVSLYDTEVEMVDKLAVKEQKIRSWLELKQTKKELENVKEDMILTKGRNFEINQILVRIMEEKYAPYVDYMSQLLDMKCAPILPQIKLSVAICGATSQQGGMRLEIFFKRNQL